MNEEASVSGAAGVSATAVGVNTPFPFTDMRHHLMISTSYVYGRPHCSRQFCALIRAVGGVGGDRSHVSVRLFVPHLGERYHGCAMV